MSVASRPPDVLLRIVERRRERLAGSGTCALAPGAPLVEEDNAFLAALAGRRGRAVIAEVKMGSPRLGSLVDRVDPLRQARAYALGGAAALSVVVEPDFFHGSYELLAACRRASGLPAIAKDFVVDPAQLLWARDAGADAVLLIAALHEAAELARYAALARGLGLVPLIETHDPADVAKLAGAPWELVGVNNRDLRTFEVDLGHSIALLPALPAGALKVAESGIAGRADVERLRASGFDAFLVGESLLLAPDPAARLRELVALTPWPPLPSPPLPPGEGERRPPELGKDGTFRGLLGGEDLARAGRLPSPGGPGGVAGEGPGVRVKICGVTRPEDALLAANLGAALLGLNFYPRSPRHLDLAAAREIAAAVAGRVPPVRLVGVFVDRPAAEVEEIAESVGLDLVQLSGDEGPAEVGRFAGRAIKAFRTGGHPGAAALAAYPDAWALLFDARHGALYGGTGLAWPYQAVAEIAAERRVFVAGGLGPGNVRAAAALSGAWGVDVCSGIESAPGIKDPAQLRRLFEEIER